MWGKKTGRRPHPLAKPWAGETVRLTRSLLQQLKDLSSALKTMWIRHAREHALISTVLGRWRGAGSWAHQPANPAYRASARLVRDSVSKTNKIKPKWMCAVPGMTEIVT